MPHTVYCIDTSALINLKQHYPSRIFPGVWQALARLVEQGRLIAPTEVREEVNRGNDELAPWLLENKAMFEEATLSRYLDKYQWVIAHYPALVDATAEHEQADPHIIALVLHKRSGQASYLTPANRVIVSESGNVEYVVVSDESLKPNKIPTVCHALGIECIKHRDLLTREKWRFELSSE